MAQQHLAADADGTEPRPLGPPILSLELWTYYRLSKSVLLEGGLVETMCCHSPHVLHQRVWAAFSQGNGHSCKPGQEMCSVAALGTGGGRLGEQADCASGKWQHARCGCVSEG